MPDKFEMTTGQAHELAMALGRNSWTNAEVKRACEGTFLADVRRLIKDEATLTATPRPWCHEEDGTIRFSVTSDGTSGRDWISRLEAKGFRVSDYAKQLLRSPSFQPTNSITTEVVMLPGKLFTDSDRMTKNIRAEAAKRNLATPNPELACLIREKFMDKQIEEMGLTWIIAMHEPIQDSDGVPELLGAVRGDGDSWLRACYGNPGNRWGHDNGFAFSVSQVGS